MTLNPFSRDKSQEWKESIGFPDEKRYAESFEKKNPQKKSNIQESLQTLTIIGATISSHKISLRFWPISEHSRKPKSFDSNQNNWLQLGKKIIDYLKRKDF